jgi:hypothetical protein
MSAKATNYSAYSFKSELWIGPDIPLTDKMAQVFAKRNVSRLMWLNGTTMFIPSDNPLIKEYALIIPYGSAELGEEEMILMPFGTFEECFTRIVNIAADEALCGLAFAGTPEGDKNAELAVRSCLAHHHIFPVMHSKD